MFSAKNSSNQAAYVCRTAPDASGKLVTVNCTPAHPVQGRHHRSDSSDSSDSREPRGLFVRCHGLNEYTGSDPNVLLHCKLYDQNRKHVGRLEVTLINGATSIQHHVILKNGAWFKEARLLGNDLTLTLPIDSVIAAAHPEAAPWQGNPNYGLFLGLDSHNKRQSCITVWKGDGNEVFEHTKYIEARCPYLMNLQTGKIERGLGCHFWFSTEYPQ